MLLPLAPPSPNCRTFTLPQPSPLLLQFMPTARSLPYAAAMMWVVKMCWIGEVGAGRQRPHSITAVQVPSNLQGSCRRPRLPSPHCCAGSHPHHSDDHAGHAAGPHAAGHPVQRLCVLQQPASHPGGLPAQVLPGWQPHICRFQRIDCSIIRFALPDLPRRPCRTSRWWCTPRAAGIQWRRSCSCCGRWAT